jgi:hypothetical protein
MTQVNTRRSHRVRAAVVASCTVATSLLAAMAAPPDGGGRGQGGPALVPPVENDVHAQINEELNVSQSSLLAVDLLDATPGQPLFVDVTIDGIRYTLDLAPHSVRAPGYQLFAQVEDGSLVAMEPGPIRTMRGSIVGIPEAFVAASLMEDGLSALIELPDVEGRYWMEPTPEAGAGMHAIYHDLDVDGPGGECGVPDDPIEDGGGEAPPAAQGANGGVAGAGDNCFWFAELAADADFLYYQTFGSSVPNVENQINSIVNGVNVQYERDVVISHQISAIIVRTSAEADPYSSTTSPVGILNEFRNYWNQNHGNIQRDMAELFTGRDLSDPVIGIAFAGFVCNSNAYSVVQNIGGFSCRTDLTAHELGHNWNANHCSCGGFTMNSALTCANQFSPSFTIQEIISYRDCSGPVNVSLCGSSFNTRVAIYENFCPTVVNQAIACNDNFCGTSSELTFDGVGGTEYLIRIGGFEGATGDGVLVVSGPTCDPPPSNDNCGSAATLTEGLTAFTSLGATTDGPVEECADGLADVWYRFLAMCDGQATISVCDADFDTQLAAYPASCPSGDNTALACNNDGCGLQSSISFSVEAGNLYRVRIAGVDGATGSGTIDFTCGTFADCNDNGVPDAEEISGGTAEDCNGNGIPDSCDIVDGLSADCNENGVPDSCDVDSGSSMDEDGDGVPDECDCPSDLSGDGTTGVDDQVALILAWGSTDPAADLDGNGTVGVDDLLLLILAWGPCP